MKKKLIPKVASLHDLEDKARVDERYRMLAMAASENLGGPCRTLNDAMQWLHLNANETNSEQGVVDEVNFCRDLI